jgi:subtilisin family serine protease
MSRSVKMLRVLGAVVSLAVPLAGAADSFYYIADGRPVTLTLDQSRIALRSSEALSQNQISRLGTRTLLTDMRPGPLPSWNLARLDQRANINTPRERFAALGQQLPEQVEFYSPVFVDQRGGQILLTDQLLIGFEPGVTPTRQQQILSTIDGAQVLAVNYANIAGLVHVRTAVRNGVDVLDRANALAALPEVRYAEPDFVFTGYGSLIPNDPEFPVQWGLNNTGQDGGVVDMDIDAPQAWDITTGDPNMLIVVLDTGVQLNHQDLNVAEAFDFTSDAGDGGPQNECDIHATWVAGCAAAIGNNNEGVSGVCPDCRIASARIGISNTPTCTLSWSGQLSWTLDALIWAESLGARVTNNSNAYNITSTAIRDKYEQMRDNGAIHFASAGNDFGSSITWPASLSAVNAVAALDRDGMLADFSNDGIGLSVSAPGVDIRTTDRTGTDGGSLTDYRFVDGTSFASPTAAGVAGLVLSIHPQLSGIDVEQVLRRSAVDLGAAGKDSTFGWGFVNAANALELAVSYGSWKERATSGPPSVSNATLAYDADRMVTVLFGGLAGFSSRGETWEWDGKTWQQRFPAHAPSNRYGHSLTYDSARGVCVLFGGFAGSAASGETWEWDGIDWTLRTPATSPDGRFLHAAAYDSDRGVTVLFGGRVGFDLDDETWEWDGTNWTQRIEPGPSVREYHAMAYDAENGRVVLYGGVLGGDETWGWNGDSWELLTTDGPGDRARHALAFDAQRRAVVLFGGYDGSDPLQDTWELSNDTWAIRSNAGPSPRFAPAMSYDSKHEAMVLYGGTDGVLTVGDTWQWRVPAPLGDVNLDDVLDAADGIALFDCLTGPGVPPLGECEQGDLQHDDDVDMADVAKLADLL